ncbi:hypothetical protein HYY75_11405 [bacterium]|nr:hypothetical protein [bacterium]
MIHSNSIQGANRFLVYAMISLLIVAFGAIGTFIASFVAPELTLVGLLLGSVLGTSLALHESTIIGCLFGMTCGLVISLFVCLMIDFETAYLVVFIFSLLGAILGEPFSYFWKESENVE